MSGTRPSMSSKTSAAVVGLGRPERLALGAAMGTPAVSISALATGCEGMRTATVASPAVTRDGTFSLLGKISVRGPGQKASIKARACGPGSPAMSGASPSGLQMCTISGLSPGRPLAANIFSTAAASSAFAPSP